MGVSPINVRIPLAVAPMLVLALLGCGHHPPNKVIAEAEDNRPAIDPNAPLIEFPDLNLDLPTARAAETPSPPDFGQVIPAGDFGVRMKAIRNANAKEKLSKGQLAVFRRSRTGTLMCTGSCFLKATPTDDPRVIWLEGTCTGPLRAGPAILEVRMKGQTYLVRSVTFR